MAITRFHRNGQTPTDHPEHQPIAVSQLTTAPIYQRLVDHRVKRMAREWDPRQVGIITVARRANGQLVIIDGQHRVRAAQLVDPHMALMCVVWEDLTLAQEAALFTELNRSRKSLTPFELFKADLIAGQFEATDIQRIAQEHGFKIAIRKGASGRINGIAALRSTYRMGPRKGVILSEVLRLHRAAWRNDVPAALMIQGLGIFLARHGEHVDHDRLRAILTRAVPEQLVARGKGMGGTMGVSARHGTAVVIGDLYNKRLRTGRLPEWR